MDRAIKRAIPKERGREGEKRNAHAMADRKTRAKHWWLDGSLLINNGERNKRKCVRQTKEKKGSRRPTKETCSHAMRIDPKQDATPGENDIKQKMKLLVGYILGYILVTIITGLARAGKERGASEQREHKRNKRGEWANSRAASVTHQRRMVQRRIQRWNKTRKVKDKDWKKYRHK
eukprot:3888860-Pleurochrysis_carterae.AAC.1